MTRSIALFFPALLLAGCGGQASLNGDGGPGPCTITLSGAITSTVTEDCAHDGDSSGNVYAFTISAEGTSDFTSLTFTAELASFSSRNYDASSATEAVTEIQATGMGSAPATWIESAHNSDTPDTGTFQLAITSTGTSIEDKGATAYFNSHGSLDATLTPLAGTSSTGNVTLHIDF